MDDNYYETMILEQCLKTWNTIPVCSGGGIQWYDNCSIAYCIQIIRAGSGGHINNDSLQLAVQIMNEI